MSIFCQKISSLDSFTERSSVLCNAISEAVVEIIVIFLMSRGNLAAKAIYNKELSRLTRRKNSLRESRNHDQSQC